MRVLFWVPYPSEGASNRYRVEQYLPYLRDAHIDYALHPFWSSGGYRVLYRRGHYIKKTYYFLAGTCSRLIDLLTVSRYTLVFIHREACPLGSAYFEERLARMGKPVIFDFDDAIFLPVASVPNVFIGKFKQPQKIRQIIKNSRQVIAGNEYLSSYARCYNPSVSVIPTAIDTQKYRPNYKRRDNERLVIGWVGSGTTAIFLPMLKEVFIKLSERFKNVSFAIVGGSYSIEGLKDIRNIGWSLESELEQLQTFDIGIMPMPDNEWTRGKCAFKAILYMSMGIPCVCSAVGMNKELLQDGENGFLADSEKEWVEKLSLLIENPALRRRIGSAARKAIEEKYSLTVNAPKFLAVINAAGKTGKGDVR